jgi:hypothetical protein
LFISSTPFLAPLSGTDSVSYGDGDLPQGRIKDFPLASLQIQSKRFANLGKNENLYISIDFKD